MKPKRRKSKPVKGWAGVIDGKLDAIPTKSGYLLHDFERPFRTRKQAKRSYGEVVRVEVREI